MSSVWSPPRRAYHLRIFAVSLGLVVAGLAAFLFGVRMEAVEPAHGIITARDLQDIHSPLNGLIELGWYEGAVVEGEKSIPVRLDPEGDGIARSDGNFQAVAHYRLGGNRSIAPDAVRFHQLQAGDELWPGQPLASLRTDEWRLQLKLLEDRLREWPSTGNHEAERAQARSDAELFRFRLARAVMHVPDTERMWLAVTVRAVTGQAVQAGDVIAAVVPADPATRQPLNLIARLEVEEKNLGDIEPGQDVRIVSSMYNHRLYGRAEARIERIEPWGEPNGNGDRRFVVRAEITSSPFSMPLGSSVKAEIIVGRKVVYRIILEH
jgi:hypothetical protein